MLFPSLSSLLVGSLATVATAAVVEYDWDITWVNAAPDGFSRPVIGVNNEWPCPTIRATKGDTIRVKMSNMLGNQTASLHFHGINQVSTNWMDGPSFVTQCPVAPGECITYEFEVSGMSSRNQGEGSMLISTDLKADAAGTYWCKFHPAVVGSSTLLVYQSQASRY